MLGIVKRIMTGMVLLLLMPLTAWCIGWQWQPAGDTLLLQGFWLVTQTVTSPWGLLTALIVTLWFFWCLRLRIKYTLGLLLLLWASVTVGQGIKALIKEQVREARPFVSWLSIAAGINEKTFYALTGQQRSELIRQQLNKHVLIPAWLGDNWQRESGFSFPSGHALFAATWALWAAGLLWSRQCHKTVIALMLWATGVMGSRLALGMHRPQDLIASVIISALLVTLFCVIFQRWSASGAISVR